MVGFPKFLILFIDRLDKDGLLKNPLKRHDPLIDVTAFADKDTLEKDEKILYSLKAVLGHP